MMNSGFNVTCLNVINMILKKKENKFTCSMQLIRKFIQQLKIFTTLQAPPLKLRTKDDQERRTWCFNFFFFAYVNFLYEY